MRNILIILLCLCALSTTADAARNKAEIVAGPMPGANSLRTTRLWLQTNKQAKVQVKYWDKNLPKKKYLSELMHSQKKDDYTLTFDIALLEPGTEYGYQVLLNGKASLQSPLTFHSQELWHWRRDAPDFTLMLGSCSYFNEEQYDRPGKGYGTVNGIFSSMAQRQPEFMLWLGDNTYTREVDYTSEAGMRYRYAHDRQLPEIQEFLQSTHHLATWDDHDYGPNNSNSSFVFKDASLKLFNDYWPNPSSGTKEIPGVFSQAHLNDVDVFILDGRFYRDADDAPDSDPEKALYGKKQMKWLQNALLSSTATFKLIAGGSQFFNYMNTSEGWNLFPTEQQAFKVWMDEAKVSGMVFLSGDRHHSELIKIDRENNYPIYELTCSPLTAGVYKSKEEREKEITIPGSMVEEHNFCEVSFNGDRKNRNMNISVYDVDGQQKWQRDISRKELRAPRK